jgi:hypothetical protein
LGFAASGAEWAEGDAKATSNVAMKARDRMGRS